MTTELGATMSDDDAPTGAPFARGDSATLQRGATLGRYIVLERLGEGGMGVVYSAYDPELDRKIAVKLLREDVGDRRARLLREAQALARLGHANIVAVYDVGTIDDQVFVAMEFVAGRTVSAWLAEAPRATHEIVDVYLQAGRGLAAAHALGIVHRDFKPDNVLIDGDKRVRVVDFGLAAIAEGAVDAPSRSPVAPEWEQGAQVATSLTRTGALVGTPGYIAPEGTTQPAFDQFSFCVAVWKGLSGELPFAGNSAAELASAAARGEIAEPARRIPARLQRVLRRGLSADPAKRFASIDDLLAALSRNRSRTYAIAGTAAIAAFAVGAIVVSSRHDGAQLCRGSDGRLAGAWDSGAIARAFAATGVPYAAASAASVAAVLDRYASGWAAMRTEACEATQVRGEQSGELMDLRMACLDARANELHALGDVFAHADAKVVERSVSAAQSLTPLADCADAAGLKAPVRMPADPASRALIETVRGGIAEARALDRAGKYDDAIARASTLAGEAHAIGYRPRVAGALTILGIARAHADKSAEAQPALEAAVVAAIAAHDDATATEAGTSLIKLVGYDQAKVADAERWIALTRAWLEAAPDDHRRAQVDNEIGSVRFEAGHYDEALALQQQALALREQEYGKDSQLVAINLDNIGVDYVMKGEPAKASDYHRRALKLEIDQLGPMHPRVGLTWTNLGASLTDEGKLDEARDAELHAIAIKEAAYGKDSAMVAASVHEIANVYFLQGHYAEAEAAYRRVMTIYKQAFGPEHPRVGNAVGSLANAVRHLHHLDEAEALYKESLAIRLKALGPKHYSLANSYLGLSQVAQERKQWDEALAEAQRAADVLAASTEADSSAIAEALGNVGNAQLGAGRFAPAIEAYTRALKIQEAKGDPSDRADTQFGLAQALWQSGDHAKARPLAEAAEKAYAAAGDRGKDSLPDVQRWLASHADKL